MNCWELELMNIKNCGWIEKRDYAGNRFTGENDSWRAGFRNNNRMCSMRVKI